MKGKMSVKKNMRSLSSQILSRYIIDTANPNCREILRDAICMGNPKYNGEMQMLPMKQNTTA